MAAELAARTRREEVRARRGRTPTPVERAAAAAATTERGEGGGDDDVEDIPRTRVPEDAADALYNVRMKTVLRGYFRHWHALTIEKVVRHQYLERFAARIDQWNLLRRTFNILQEKRWFALVEERTERRYNTVLAMKVWQVWVQKTAAIVQRTHEVRQRILVRKYFNAWRTLVVENEEKIRLFQLSNVFWKWRERARERKQLEVVAQRVYEANLCHRAYWTWFFKLCSLLGERRHMRTLREQAFDAWIEKAEGVIRMNRMADAFYRRRTLQVLFNHWSERTVTCIEQEAAALDHAEWKLTERAFDSWRRQAQTTPLMAAMGEYVNDRVVSNFMTLWRQRTRQAKSAEATAQRKSLHIGLKTWRLRLRWKIMNEQVNERIQTSTVQNWILQARLREFQHYKAANICRATLVHWSYHLHKLTSTLRKIAHRVVILRNRGTAADLIAGLRQRVQFRREEQMEANTFYNRLVLGKAIVRWRSKTQQIQFMRIMRADAIRVHQTHLLSKSLARWRLKTDLCRMYDDWADDAVYYFTVRRTMHTWKAAFKNHRRNRLREAFHTQARRTKRELAGKVLEHWVAKYDRIRYLNDAARSFSRGRVEEAAANSIQLWRLQNEEITTIRRTAEEFNNTRLLRTFLQFWVDHRRYIRDIDEDAEILYEAQNTKIASKYFQIWERKGWHLKVVRMTGDRFERKRYKNLLKSWRNAALEKVESRAWLEGRGIDETIDEGFGVDWAEPLAPNQPPPSARVRSPVQGQDLGRSVFGRSTRGGQESSLRRSVLGQSVLGQSVRGTPGGGNSLLLQTPGWRRSRLFSRTPAGNPMTPRNVAQTPGSPLMRFSNRRGGQLSVMDESQYE